MPKQKIELTFATHPNIHEINALDFNAQEDLQARLTFCLISFATLYPTGRAHHFIRPLFRRRECDATRFMMRTHARASSACACAVSAR
jgi:hypothetical protein